MRLKSIASALLAGAALTAAGATPTFAEFHSLSADDAALELSLLGRYQTGIFEESAAEIVSYDAETQRSFVVNAASGEVDILDLSDPANPSLISSISVSDIGDSVNSVSVGSGLVALAVQAENATDNGSVAFYDLEGNRLSVVEVGALPDALTFSPNGNWVLVVNEGEPREDYAAGASPSSGGGDVLLGEVVRENRVGFHVSVGL